jgi:hypothetical protein
MKKRLIQGSILLVFVFVVLCPIAAVEAGGYWQQEPPIIEIANGGKSCQVGQWPDQSGWQRQIVDFSATHVNFGFSHPKVQPGWSRVKAWWQAPPAVLYPKQKISFQFGANIVGWHPLRGDVAVWVYKMPGIGPGEQLGAVYAKTSGSYTTKLHQVPDGFSGEAPRDARLGYFMGVNDGCRTIFMYKWVPDKSGQGTATPTPAKQGLTIEPNTDRYGSDYKYLRGVDSPAACRSICAGESACRAYTWVKAGYMEEQALCWLKNAVPAPTRNDNCVSGVKQK